MEAAKVSIRTPDAQHEAHSRECTRDPERIRPRSGRNGQLRDKVPDQRRMRVAREAVCARKRVPVRGSGVCVWPKGRSMLPVRVPGTASTRPGAKLRCGWSTRCTPRPGGSHPGDGGNQAHSREGDIARRAPAARGRPFDDVPHDEATPGSRLSGLRHTRHHQTRRLQCVLRHPTDSGAGGRPPTLSGAPHGGKFRGIPVLLTRRAPCHRSRSRPRLTSPKR